MRIKWYWPAKMLGLVKDISHEYNDGAIHTRVSAKAGDIFFCLHPALPVVLFILGFIISFFIRDKSKKSIIKKVFNILIIILLVYAVLLAIGIAPYLEFYPRGGGFIDLTVFENIVHGIYTAITAFALWLGKTAGLRLNKNKEK